MDSSIQITEPMCTTFSGLSHMSVPTYNLWEGPSSPSLTLGSQYDLHKTINDAGLTWHYRTTSEWILFDPKKLVDNRYIVKHPEKPFGKKQYVCLVSHGTDYKWVTSGTTRTNAARSRAFGVYKSPYILLSVLTWCIKIQLQSVWKSTKVNLINGFKK